MGIGCDAGFDCLRGFSVGCDDFGVGGFDDCGGGDYCCC